MKLTTEVENYTLTFELEKDAEYTLHEKFDSLNTRTMKMFKKGDIVAYNVNVHAVPLSNNHDPLLFFESGFLFSPDGDKSMEDLKEFLEESPFIEDVINKIKIYEKLGSLK